jgi:hypothetical protein
MTSDGEMDFLAHTELLHYIAGEVVRYNIRHPGQRFDLATPERMPELPALSCGIVDKGGRQLIFTLADWRGRPEAAAERAVAWMNE